jgi:hypothetical protein
MSDVVKFRIVAAYHMHGGVEFGVDLIRWDLDYILLLTPEQFTIQKIPKSPIIP